MQTFLIYKNILLILVWVPLFSPSWLGQLVPSLGLLLWVGQASVHLYQLLHGHLHLPRLVVTGGAAHGARQLQGGSHVGLHILHVDFGDLLLRLLDHCLKINIIICKTGTENFYVHCTPYSCLHTTGCHCTLVLYSVHWHCALVLFTASEPVISVRHGQERQTSITEMNPIFIGFI